MALDDLPHHRRDVLLWRFMGPPLFYDYEAVSEHVRERAGGACRLSGPDDGDTVMRRNPRTPASRLRARLVDALGPMCHCCGLSPGFGVDHDQFTGVVRGVLCFDCASRIDNCAHADGCAFAAYLNHPPAAYLGLLFYRRSKMSPSALGKIEQLGFNPLYRGQSSLQ